MPIDVDRYLARIGYVGSTEPTAPTLAALQSAHMVAAPFENTFVYAKAPVRTGLDWSVPKVVDRGRGGWCFELNGAFGALLGALGFEVRHLSAQVWDGKAAALGPALDHLCLEVTVDGTRWLADVGFGDSALTPLRLDDTAVQERQPRHCRLERHGHAIHYLEAQPDGAWELQYVVDPTPRSLPEFEGRSDALSDHALGSPFTTKPFATRALAADGSRVWLLKDRLRLRAAEGSISEEPVDEDAWDETLHRWFGFRRP